MRQVAGIPHRCLPSPETALSDLGLRLYRHIPPPGTASRTSNPGGIVLSEIMLEPGYGVEDPKHIPQVPRSSNTYSENKHFAAS